MSLATKARPRLPLPVRYRLGRVWLAFKCPLCPSTCGRLRLTRARRTPVHGLFLAHSPQGFARDGAVSRRVANDAFGNAVADWSQINRAAVVLSMFLVANAQLVRPNNQNVWMAYSSIATMAMRLDSALRRATELVWSKSMLVYLAIYGTMNNRTFAFILGWSKRWPAGHRHTALNMYSKRATRVRRWRCCAAVSLAGVPPDAGFFANWACASGRSTRADLACRGQCCRLAIRGLLLLRIVFLMYLPGPEGDDRLNEGKSACCPEFVVAAAVIMVVGIV